MLDEMAHSIEMMVTMRWVAGIFDRIMSLVLGDIECSDMVLLAAFRSMLQLGGHEDERSKGEEGGERGGRFEAAMSPFRYRVRQGAAITQFFGRP